MPIPPIITSKGIMIQFDGTFFTPNEGYTKPEFNDTIQRDIFNKDL